MKFIDFILLGWIFKYVTAGQYNESISFSPHQSFMNVPSFWHDTITFPQNISIIEQGINVKIHLNEFNGLLFYAIDSNYRTFWVEFSEENLELNYYNFSMDESRKFSIKITEICNSINSNKINLKFSSKYDQIEIICNDNSNLIELVHFNFKNYLPNNISDKFFETFPLPIPQFGNSTKDVRVYIWIGNTPSIINKTLYRNKRLTPNSKNLFGCLQQFAINNVLLKLASTGVHFGDMINRFCQPMCNPNPCYNNGQCIELWRGQYSCDCKQTYFLGKHCDLEYSIQFNGTFSFRDFVDFNFTNLMFSFKYYQIYDKVEHPIIALELSENNRFLIYISKNEYIHAKFISNRFNEIDVKSSFSINSDKRYIVSAKVITEYIQVNIQIPNSGISTDIYIPINNTNLIINHLNVGNYKFLDKEKIFKGCFTNLVLKSESKEYIWNTMKNFSNYPSCNEFIKTTSQTKYTSTLPITTCFTTENGTLLTIPSTKSWKNNNLIYIIIGTIIGIIILIGVILYKFKMKSKLKKRSGLDTIEYTSVQDILQPLQMYRLSSDIQPKPPYESRHSRSKKTSIDSSQLCIPADEIAV